MTIQSTIIIPSPSGDKRGGIIQIKELHWLVQEDWPQLSSKYNIRFKHDPNWRGRFFSVQSAADVMANKDGHIGWIPVKHLFIAAQAGLFVGPIVTMAQGYLTGKYIAYLFGAVYGGLLGVNGKKIRDWIFWYRFNRVLRKTKRT